MTRKARPAAAVPSLVGERLRMWGACVRKQRVAQRMTANELCRRLDISHPTLQRLERGEATIGAAFYLAALQVLGVLELAVPELPGPLWLMDDPGIRARTAWDEDDDYF